MITYANLEELKQEKITLESEIKAMERSLVTYADTLEEESDGVKNFGLAYLSLRKKLQKGKDAKEQKATEINALIIEQQVV